MVELLLAHGADVNAKDVAGRTPLHEAQRELTKEEAAAMSQISGGTIDFNAKPKPIPHDVEDKRFKELLELLIANKADINARDNGGETPMHIAAWFGGRKNDMVGVLLAHGADVNAKNKYDMTPLHSACWGSAWKGNKEVVKLLLEHKADTNIKAAKVFPDVEGGWTPLHIAAGGGSKEVVELLLENKADINAKTEDEKTALHFAAMRKSEDGVVDLLLAKGLNINAKDKNGKTPLHIALDGNHKDTVERLRQHGAKE
jgi:cytohesin